jgi:ribose/xylose/arabinose/galactoside ABC-type transport system permease subunit
MAFEGFREFGSEYVPARRETATFEVSSSPPVVGVTDESTLAMANRVPPPNLDLVFDDPADGEPGRDRMIVHGLWELVLAIGLAVVGFLLYQAEASAFSAGGLRTLLLNTTVLGLVAAASAIALRAGAPNLAVGAVAVTAAVYYGQHSGAGIQRTWLIILGVAAAVGLVQGLVVVGLHVPAWATSLAVGLGVFAWATEQGPATFTGGYDPGPHAYYWFGGFCAISLVASVVGLVPTVRRAVGRFRPVADPARRRGVVAGLIVIGATVGSTLLAAVGGVLSVLVAHRAQPSDGIALTALALGVALLGGRAPSGGAAGSWARSSRPGW